MTFFEKFSKHFPFRLRYIPTTLITPAPYAVRRDQDPDITRLSHSIEQLGLLTPVLVMRKGFRSYELLAGRRRFLAAEIAGLSYIPCAIVKEGGAAAEILALAESSHKNNINFIDEAEALRRLISVHGLSLSETAELFSLSAQELSEKLAVLSLSKAHLAILRREGLLEGHAAALLLLEDDDERGSVLEKIISEKMSPGAALDYVRYLKEPSEKPHPAPLCLIDDARFFINSVKRGVDTMRQSGIKAELEAERDGSDISITIKIKDIKETVK